MGLHHKMGIKKIMEAHHMMRINNVLQIHVIEWEHFHFFWTILIYLKVSISSIHKILPLQRVIMVYTVNISRQMERNANLGISDFYLVEDGEGKLDWTGTMDLCRVLEIVRKKVFEQKSCDLSAWVPVKLLPCIPTALDQVLKSPDLLKNIFME